jgi:hypothetical protein
MGNNQGGVLVSSTVYLQLIQDGIFNMETRLKSFLGFLFSPIIPSSFNFEETYINLFAIKYRPLPGNGGFPGVYTYIWGGYFLLVLFAYFIRKKFLWGFGRVDYAITAFLFCTFPRWHSYNLIILIKLLFWMIILISICDTLTKKWRTRCDPISPVL